MTALHDSVGLWTRQLRVGHVLVIQESMLIALMKLGKRAGLRQAGLELMENPLEV
jgi:hypothetical protein